VVPEPGNARFTFSRDVWGFFERTAKGQTGKISLQRIVGGQLRNAVSKTVTFASTPLRGKIFYTQYGGGSDMMRLDPGGDIPAVKAFSTVNGCPVCHSMSANGTKFATSNWTWSTNGGISNVDAAGNLTVLSDFPNPNTPYGNGGNDWRGFAWAPFTPDGKYIFATNNIYGNTKQSVVGIDTTTREVSLPAVMVSGCKPTTSQPTTGPATRGVASIRVRISIGLARQVDQFRLTRSAWSGTVKSRASSARPRRSRSSRPPACVSASAVTSSSTNWRTTASRRNSPAP
jgi:hypothetical protein